MLPPTRGGCWTPCRRSRVSALWLQNLRSVHHPATPLISFADELQKDWQLVPLSVLPKETVVTVRTTVSHAVPSPVGRDGSSIMSYPAIRSELEEAEFVFQKCLVVRVWDEAALSMWELNPNPQFEGRTFRRYTKFSRCSICTRSHRFPVFTINLTSQTRSSISFARRRRSSPFVAPSLRIN